MPCHRPRSKLMCGTVCVRKALDALAEALKGDAAAAVEKPEEHKVNQQPSKRSYLGGHLDICTRTTKERERERERVSE